MVYNKNVLHSILSKTFNVFSYTDFGIFTFIAFINLYYIYNTMLKCWYMEKEELLKFRIKMYYWSDIKMV